MYRLITESNRQNPQESGFGKSHSTQNSFQNSAYDFSGPVNGNTKSVSNRGDRAEGNLNKKPNKTGENVYLVPNRVNQLARKQSDTSGTGSEADSLLDLYKSSDGKSTSNGHGDKSKTTSGPKWNQDQLDDSNWIHRDKLAQIESRELEEAGLRPRDISRTSSKRTREQSNERRIAAASVDEQSDKSNSHWQERRTPVIPTIPDGDEDPESSPYHWDSRFSEDALTDRERENPSVRNHAIRPSTSRIPVPKSGPIPAPNAPTETRKTRSRVGSSASTNESPNQGRARARSGSVGSQILLDDADEPEFRNPGQTASNFSSPGSPPKTRASGKASTPSNAKKPSSNRANAQPKQRSSSTSSPAKRPGTSSGSSRPPTARPEGEAPWIATMYKPDPSLPPDQQIIPTHAKRLQQEQWEKEGKTGSIYDRDFRLLNTETFAKPDVKPLELEKTEIAVKSDEPETEQWPLPSPSSARPGTSGTEHGGYKTMPTINNSQAPPRSTPTPLPAASPKPQEIIRVEDPPEPVKDKKRCCCIVM